MSTSSAHATDTERSAPPAKLVLEGKELELPVVVGTENEKGIDISQLRGQTGYITLDDGYKNTGSCQSDITFIDGEKGILRYRGYPIEELAAKSTFVEVAYLVIFGELPTRDQLARFKARITEHTPIHYDMRHHFQGFPSTSHPMAILSAMFNAASCYSPHLLDPYIDDESFLEAVARLTGKTSTIAAYTYKKLRGMPFRYPNPDYSYCQNFLHMMFSVPNKDFELKPEFVKGLSLFLILHADHEQNCSTSTVRMVGSSQANLFASVSAGVCALWGPLHGGANVKVVQMLEEIQQTGKSVSEVVAMAKNKESGFRLFGFGHRVYKNFDPRARILKKAADDVLDQLKMEDSLLDIAKELEQVALEDDYFVERKLYPNVDFYSGILLRAIGIPVNMFTVMFAMGRMPGWIANWKEVRDNPKSVINRPRQIYQGPAQRSYVPIDER